jgi:hypothetical protein
MAFPGTYNIDYYKGDTYEFRIYPKDSSGAPFSLYGYSAQKFTIAPTRGESDINNIINCYAAIENDNILCVIRPSDGEKLDVAKSPYYFDVEIENASGNYVKLYTLLTGAITVTEQVTPKKLVPNQPTNVTITNITATSFTVNWTAPTSGEAYNGYTIGYNSSATLVGATTASVASGLTSYTFTDVTPGAYYVGIVASNSSGASTPAYYNGIVAITGGES